MRDLANRYLAAYRAGWFGRTPVITDRGVPTDDEVSDLEARVGCKLPSDMKEWLKMVGFCTIDEDLNFQPTWFRKIDNGHLSGASMMAQDTLGNFYAFDPADQRVVFFSRSEPGHAVLAESFTGFLAALEERDFKILHWVETLALKPYGWVAV